MNYESDRSYLGSGEEMMTCRYFAAAFQLVLHFSELKLKPAFGLQQITSHSLNSEICGALHAPLEMGCLKGHKKN